MLAMKYTRLVTIVCRWSNCIL